MHILYFVGMEGQPFSFMCLGLSTLCAMVIELKKTTEMK